MRPTDDNPSGPKSPQIIPHTRSSKDGPNETTLARLERAGPRRSGTASGRVVRLALLGSSGLLVVGLVSALVSLARDDVEPVPVLGASAVEHSIPVPSVDKPAPILDDHDDRNIATVDTAEPPALVRLTSDQGDRPDYSVDRIAPALPARLGAKPPVVKPVLSKPVRVAVKPPVAVVVASAPAGLVRKSSLPRKAQAVSFKKTRAVALLPKVEAAMVDTDVALLSAILSQSSRHAGQPVEPEVATCAEAAELNRRCTDKGTAQRP